MLGAFAKARARVGIVILDACRDNPLKRRDNRPIRGLAQMDARLGSLIAFAASAGQTSREGLFGRNSVYTTELLKVLSTPGLRLTQIFNQVRKRVAHISRGDQLPVEFTALAEEFYFKRGTRIARRTTGPIDVKPHRKAYEAVRALSVRESPRLDARRLARIAALAPVRATGIVEDLGWVRVALSGGRQGFVPEDLLRAPFDWRDVPFEGRFRTQAATPVYAQPRSASVKRGTIPARTRIAATARVSGLPWIRVRHGGIDGYVDRTRLNRPFRYRVAALSGRYETVTDVNVLAEPRMGARTVATLGRREKIDATGRVEGRDWFRIRTARGIEGYIRDYSIEKPFDWTERPFSGRYRARVATTLRREPRRTAHGVSEVGACGAMLVASARVADRGWLKVRDDAGIAGYVPEDALQFVDPADRRARRDLPRLPRLPGDGGHPRRQLRDGCRPPLGASAPQRLDQAGLRHRQI